MKKFLFLIGAVLMLLITSCDPKDHYDFNEVIANDLAMVTEQYGDVFFYESQAKFDKVITEGNAKVVWIYSVFGVPEKRETIFVIHEEGDYESPGKIEVVEDIWLEDIKFDPNVEISLEDALERLLATDIVVPETELVVLRKPLWYPEPENPYYIFGDGSHGFVKVDAKTGEVTKQN